MRVQRVRAEESARGGEDVVVLGMVVVVMVVSFRYQLVSCYVIVWRPRPPPQRSTAFTLTLNPLYVAIALASVMHQL